MLSRINGITKDEYYDENYVFVCTCGDLRDTLFVTVWNWESDLEVFKGKTFKDSLSEYIEVFLTPSASHFLGYFDRFKTFFKYLFLKSKCTYDVMEFRTKDIESFRKILVDFRVKVAELAAFFGQQNDLPAPQELKENQVCLKCKSGKELIFSISETSREDFGIDVLEMFVCLPQNGFFKRLKHGLKYFGSDSSEYLNLTYEDAGKLHSLLAKMKLC